VTVDADDPNRHLALIGLSGVGKSTIGRLLASELGLQWCDLDERLERKVGRTIADIFSTDGEPHFRSLESEVLTEALAEDRRMVISTGGGVILAAENRTRLAEQATCIWLRSAPERLAYRVARDTGRPLLAGQDQGAVSVDPVAAVTERLITMLETRGPLYTESADLILDVDRLRIPEVLHLLVAHERASGWTNPIETETAG